MLDRFVRPAEARLRQLLSRNLLGEDHFAGSGASLFILLRVSTLD